VVHDKASKTCDLEGHLQSETRVDGMAEIRRSAIVFGTCALLAFVTPHATATSLAPQAGAQGNLDVGPCQLDDPTAKDTTLCKLCMAMEIGCESARHGPVIDGAPTWEVRYVDAKGTNFHVQNVALLTMKRGAPQLLWAHRTLDVSAFPKHLEPVQQSIVYRWRYSTNGQMIFVDGAKTLGTVDSLWTGAARGRHVRLEPERYCYTQAWGQFLPC